MVEQSSEQDEMQTKANEQTALLILEIAEDRMSELMSWTNK